MFLSVVRTVPPNWTPRDQDPARQARSLFGHLCLYNRLNVSMSRQKKLLVAVGDPSLVTHDLAADFIPGLVDFYRLAGGAKALKSAARQQANPEPEQVAPEPESEQHRQASKGCLRATLRPRRGVIHRGDTHSRLRHEQSLLWRVWTSPQLGLAGPRLPHHHPCDASRVDRDSSTLSSASFSA